MKYKIDGVRVIITEDEPLVAGSVNLHYAEFTFDSSWNEYPTIIAVFRNGSEEREQILTDGKCLIPWEVLAESGTLNVGVYGKAADKLRPTLWAVGKTINKGAEASEAATEPTKDIWQQLLEEIKRIAGADYAVIAPIVYEYMAAHVNDFKGQPGQDGGYYIPSAERTEEGIRITFTPSQAGMPDIPVTDIPIDTGLTPAKKEEVGKFLTNSVYVTIPADSWTDDYDAATGDNQIRVQLNVGKEGAWKTIIGYDTTTSSKSVKLTDEWQTFETLFEPLTSVDELRIRVWGGPNAKYTQPFDIADIKLYIPPTQVAPDKVNLLPDDIAQLRWSPNDSTVEKFAVSYEDDTKYIHVWKRSSNKDAIIANTGVALDAPIYVLECRMRSKGKQPYTILPFEQIRDSSATQITPALSSAALCLEHGVRGFAQRVGEIAFTADTQPTEDVTVAVSATFGRGGSMVNATDTAAALDTVLLSLIGEVSE